MAENLIDRANYYYETGWLKMDAGRGYQAIYNWGQAYNIAMEAMGYMM